MRTLILLAVAVTIGCSAGSENTGTEPLTESLDMQEQLFEFVQSPNRETYLVIRERVITLDSYEPYSSEFDTASELCDEQKFEEARDTLQNAMNNLMLSPRAHQLLGFLHHKLENEHASKMELVIGRACIEGILATGDGSKDNPYTVVRTSDEYDVIEYLEKQLETQSLVQHEDKYLDLIQCSDGTECWFDITDAYKQLAKSFEQ